MDCSIWSSPSKWHLLLPSCTIKIPKVGSGMLGPQRQSYLVPRFVTLHCGLAFLPVWFSCTGVNVSSLFLLSVLLQGSCWAGEAQAQGYRGAAEDCHDWFCTVPGDMLQGCRQGHLLLHWGQRCLCILIMFGFHFLCICSYVELQNHIHLFNLDFVCYITVI